MMMWKYFLALTLAAVLPSWVASAQSAAPGTQVVDAKGTVVGYVYGPSVSFEPLERKIGGRWYNIHPGIVSEGLLAQNIVIPVYACCGSGFLYTSTDCSGTAYLQSDDVPPFAYFVNSAVPPISYTPVSTATIYYPRPPYKTMPIGSAFEWGTNGAACLSHSGQVNVGTVGKQKLTVIPPLSVQ
jgi:hypothetical protein